MAAIGRASICVVLVPAGSTPEEALRTSLGNCDCRLVECQDAAMAMAELCLSDRAEHSRSAWGLEHGSAASLVVVDPETQAAWADLRGAVRRHLPRVRILSWSRGALEEIAAPVEREGGRPAQRLDAAEAVVSGEEIAMLLQRPEEMGP
jgi:hypothetical protein